VLLRPSRPSYRCTGRHRRAPSPGTAITTRHRAITAADLAALAAVGPADQGPDAACVRARSVAERMAAWLVSCRLEQ
jgi:hypothetical protein